MQTALLLIIDDSRFLSFLHSCWTSNFSLGAGFWEHSRDEKDGDVLFLINHSGFDGFGDFLSILGLNRCSRV